MPRLRLPYCHLPSVHISTSRRIPAQHAFFPCPSSTSYAVLAHLPASSSLPIFVSLALFVCFPLHRCLSYADSTNVLATRSSLGIEFGVASSEQVNRTLLPYSVGEGAVPRSQSLVARASGDEEEVLVPMVSVKIPERGEYYIGGTVSAVEASTGDSRQGLSAIGRFEEHYVRTFERPQELTEKRRRYGSDRRPALAETAATR
ncbi:hypothetical protein C8Q77DRAFT_252303 [Trametes polyzona]|nr:hypothetical protein C8Q77DRAFT_252303 [Trametes polyzona]